MMEQQSKRRRSSGVSGKIVLSSSYPSIESIIQYWMILILLCN